MKRNQPRHPIVIIGAGIAGLAAAITLRDMGIPFIILERFPRAGGRLISRIGDGWIADHGTQFITHKDMTLVELIRKVGLERDQVTVQGAIFRLTADHHVEAPPRGGVDPSRICIDGGFGLLTSRLGAELGVQHDRAVSTVRWANNDKVFWWQQEGKVFWFEDEAGDPIRDLVTRELLLGSGLIMATTGTAAAAIARRSPCLENLVPILSSVSYTQTFTGIFKLPRQHFPFFALRGDAHCSLSWISFEEGKHPGRVDEDHSVMVVHASPRLSAELMGMGDGEAMAAIYAEARRALPELPEMPISQTFKRWTVSQLESPPIGSPVEAGMPAGRWPTNPPMAPFGLAGDYVKGAKAEHAAQSGIEAAQAVVAQLPPRRTVLGIELPV